MVQIVYHLNLNFGDLMNFPLFSHYLNFIKYGISYWEHIKRGEDVCLGIGTLPDLHLPREWFEGRKVTLLGTGTRNFDDKWEGLDWKGFTRGKLSERKLGLPGLGDLGLLIDRVFSKPKERFDQTLIELDHLLAAKITPHFSVPNPKLLITVRAVTTVGIAGVYKVIASSRYVVADRLHIAMAAEAAEVPWVIYDHQKGGLPAVPGKFLDWTSTIGKERFIVTDEKDIGIVEENTDFEASAKQKDVLERAIYEALG